MKITQIRNATLHINYAGVRFLIDPMLADQYAYPSLPSTVNSDTRNPTALLPMTIAEIIVHHFAVVANAYIKRRRRRSLG